MKQKLSDVYDSLQELDIKPTPNNVSIMAGVFSCLREIYKELEEKENVGSSTENGTTADPC